MEHLKGGIFISAKEVSLITGLHIQNAHKEHLSIRDALGIKSKKLTVRQFCEYNQLDQAEVIEYLNKYR